MSRGFLYSCFVAVRLTRWGIGLAWVTTDVSLYDAFHDLRNGCGVSNMYCIEPCQGRVSNGMHQSVRASGRPITGWGVSSAHQPWLQLVIPQIRGLFHRYR